MDLDLSVDSIRVELTLVWEICVWLDWSELVDYTFAHSVSYLGFGSFWLSLMEMRVDQWSWLNLDSDDCLDMVDCVFILDIETCIHQ